MSDNADGKMVHPESEPVLNGLLATELYSLANYLLNAPPWTHPGDEPLVEAVRRIAAEQRADAVRIGQLLVRRYGYVEPGTFPMEFTGYNEVALDHLARPLIEYQRSTINAVAQCCEQLAGDPEAKQLCQEVLARERQHLEVLTHLPVHA